MNWMDVIIFRKDTFGNETGFQIVTRCPFEDLTDMDGFMELFRREMASGDVIDSDYEMGNFPFYLQYASINQVEKWIEKKMCMGNEENILILAFYCAINRYKLKYGEDLFIACASLAE